MLEVNKIYCGDCLELMKQIPDKSIDAVIADPPYGIGNSNGTIGKKRAHKINYDLKFIDNEEYIKNKCVPAVNECLRVSKCMALTPGPKYLTYYPAPDSFGTFYQPATMGMQKFGRADSQPIFYYGQYPYLGKRIDFCSYALTESASCDLHPCSKPLQAWIWLLLMITKPNDLILDPFLGSGTTAVAAIKTGRRFIGIEISPKYCEIAQKRVDAELAQERIPFQEYKPVQEKIFSEGK